MYSKKFISFAIAAAIALGSFAIVAGSAHAGLLECSVSGFPPMVHCKVG